MDSLIILQPTALRTGKTPDQADALQKPKGIRWYKRVRIIVPILSWYYKNTQILHTSISTPSASERTPNSWCWWKFPGLLRPPVQISSFSRICLTTFCWSWNSPCDETTIILCVGVTNASHNCCYCNSAQWAPSETRTFEVFFACQRCSLIKHRSGGEADKRTYPKVMKKHHFLVQEVDGGDAKREFKTVSFGDAPEDKQWQEHTATPWRRFEIELHVGT